VFGVSAVVERLRRRSEMSGMPTMYCSACGALRAIHDWHEQRELLLIELEPCGHVTLRNARVEWLAPRMN
jgi:hypothetical protein